MDSHSQGLVTDACLEAIEILGVEIIVCQCGVEWVVNWSFTTHERNTMVKKTFFKDVLVIRRIVFSIPHFSEKRHKKDGRITTEKDVRTSSES